MTTPVPTGVFITASTEVIGVLTLFLLATPIHLQFFRSCRQIFTF
jgi:hypothetical protein